jgi:CRP-like cAMP-binding protein
MVQFCLKITFLSGFTMADDDYIRFEAGERILKKGDKADIAYMITKGKVRVFLKNNDKIVDLAILGEGEIFGETAVFDGGQYGANVIAIEDCTLTPITPARLKTMLDESDPFLGALIKMLSTRLNETNKKLVESETREFMDIAFI